MKDFLINEMTKRFGTIKRARNCHLYTAKGIRLTDMYQEGGRAILGWGKGTALTVFKNVLERKIIGSFDTDFSPKANGEKSQLSKAVSELLASERKVFVFNSKADGEKAAESLGSYKYYRPWNQENIDWREIPVVLIEPPFPFGDTVFILAVSEDSDSEKLSFNTYRIPAPLCAAITRSIYDLIKELQNREEKNWFIYDTVLSKYWTRKGPYLFPKVPEEKYKDFILHCLDCNIVISPDYSTPSIIPFGADKGNFTKLKNEIFEF